MNNQILYDKEISVTLYRTPENTEPEYQVQAIQGYAENIVSGRKILSAGAGVIYKNSSLGESFPTSVSIEFHEGSKRRVFAGYRRKADGTEYAVYKTLKATGALYKLNTLEELKTGLRPDGSLFKTGDRVRIKEDGSLWNVYITSGISELSVDKTETEEEVANVLYIETTNSGLKPDMSLTISLLPGQNCYNAVLKVRNLNLADTDIRTWTRMTITAGYRNGPKVSYSCPIFASYIEEPNPDGITVFEGITVGTADNILNNRYMEIIFHQEEIRLIDLVNDVAKGVSPNIAVECSIDDDIMNTTIHMSKQTVYAQNGAAVLSWLQTTVSQFIQNISTQGGGTPVSAFVELVDNTLYVIALNGPNKIPVRKESIISLDMVSGATFNGTALTVIAPWNPSLQPGGLFYMPPEFINGSKLPNILSAADYRNNDNLYRALTISVSFATVENTNKMEILAVPAQYAKEFPSTKSTLMRGDLLARALSKDIAYPKAISVGKSSGTELSEINNIHKDDKKTNKVMFDNGRNVLELWGTWTSVRVTAEVGSCLSTILDYYFLRDPSGPKLQKDLKGDGKQYNYYKDRSYYEKQSNAKALLHPQNSGCSANTLWWPLVMVGTYWRWVAEGEDNKSNNWCKIDPKNPDKIPQNFSLYVPVWSGTWESMTSKMKLIKDIWKYAYQEYKALYPGMANTWRAMYYFMGGTDELG